uniref:Uncharacterized protein n=1 Tax=Setaria italica TaxID=4555 RepID=K3ZFZ9_SETIT
MLLIWCKGGWPQLCQDNVGIGLMVEFELGNDLRI